MRAGLLRAASVRLGLALAVGACSDTPTSPAADLAAPLLTLTEESSTVAAAGGTVYDFDDVELATGGFPCEPAGEGYRDLTFVEGTSDEVPAGHLWFCWNIFEGPEPEGISLVSFHGDVGAFEDRVEFGSPPTSVAVDVVVLADHAPTTVTAYDEAGAVLDVALADLTKLNEHQVLTVSGGGVPVASVGLSSPNVGAFYDVITAFTDTDPVHRDECKDGGWEAFGFRNQGQCVRFVETGKDSRP